MTRLLLSLLVFLVAHRTASANDAIFTFNPGNSVTIDIIERKTTSHMSDSTALFSVGSEAIASLSIVKTGRGYWVTDSLLDFVLSLGSDTPPTRLKEAFQTSVVVLELDNNGLALEVPEVDSSLNRLDTTIGQGWTSIMQKARGDGGEKTQKAKQWNRRLQPLLGKPVEVGTYFFNEGEYPDLTGEPFRFFDVIRVVDTSRVNDVLVATLVIESHSRPGDLLRVTGLDATVIAEAFDLLPEEWENLDTVSSLAHVRTERKVTVRSMMPQSEKSEAEVLTRRSDIGGVEVTVRLIEVSEMTFEYRHDSGRPAHK